MKIEFLESKIEKKALVNNGIRLNIDVFFSLSAAVLTWKRFEAKFLSVDGVKWNALCSVVCENHNEVEMRWLK